MPEPVIDLGEDREPAQAEPEPPKWTVVQLRRMGALLVGTVLLAVSQAGASPLPKSPFTLLVRFEDRVEHRPAEPISGVFIKRERDRVVVFGPDGRRRWHVNVEPRSFPRVTAAHGQLVFEGTGGFTESFDQDTGDLMWRLRGDARVVGDFVVRQQGDSLYVYDFAGPRLLRSLPVGKWSYIDQQRETVLTVDDNGRLSEYELATGDLIASTLIADLTSGSIHGTLGSEFLVFARGRDTYESMEWTYLDRDTLRPIPERQIRWNKRSDCGPVICARERLTSQYAILDKETGAVLWSVPSWQKVVRVSAGLLILGPFGQLSYSMPPQQWRALDLVDRHHKSLAEVWGWTVLVYEEDQVQPILLKPSDGSTEVALLTSKGVRMLGELPGELDNCRYQVHLLVCRTADNFTEVWRIDF